MKQNETKYSKISWGGANICVNLSTLLSNLSKNWKISIFFVKLLLILMKNYRFLYLCKKQNNVSSAGSLDLTPQDFKLIPLREDLCLPLDFFSSVMKKLNNWFCILFIIPVIKLLKNLFRNCLS